MPTLDFVQMVQNFSGLAENGGVLWMLVTAICWLMAGVFGYMAVMQLKAVAEDGRTSMRTPVFTFIAASLMASSPTFLQSVFHTAFGGNGDVSPLAYVVDSGASSSPFKAVMMVVSFIGYCFFVRGIWVLKEAGEPQRYSQSTVGKAIAICVAGMFGIYIDWSLGMLANTFGWDISTYISS